MKSLIGRNTEDKTLLIANGVLVVHASLAHTGKRSLTGMVDASGCTQHRNFLLCRPPLRQV